MPIRAPLSARSPHVQVGIDLVSVERIEASIAEFGDRFLTRVFTAHELAHCRPGPERARGLAARFAAKEATLKVLRPDRRWVDWRSIEVQRAERGYCEIALHGEARALASDAGIEALSVSITHEDAYAGAVVIGQHARAKKPRRLRALQSKRRTLNG